VQNDAVQRMKALEFLVGEWHLDYTYRQGGETRRDLVGSGTLRPILDDRYLAFDYQVRNRESGKSGGSTCPAAPSRSPPRPNRLRGLGQSERWQQGETASWRPDPAAR